MRVAKNKSIFLDMKLIWRRLRKESPAAKKGERLNISPGHTCIPKSQKFKILQAQGPAHMTQPMSRDTGVTLEVLGMFLAPSQSFDKKRKPGYNKYAV
jgi:hypothetical protein